MTTLVCPSAPHADFDHTDASFLVEDYETTEVDECILGDFQVLPPEVLEQIMAHMSPVSLLPLMLSNAIFYGLASSERIWDHVYSRYLPNTHAALHQAENPALWTFDSPSAVRFISSCIALRPEEAPPVSPDDEVRDVMLTMQKGFNSPLIQLAAVYIIRRLAYYPIDCDSVLRSRVERCRELLGTHEAIESLLRVIFLYPDDISLLSGALCAIGNTVIDSTNCKRLVEVAGLKLILAALKRHPHSFPVIDFGCFALSNIADEVEIRPHLLSEGALDYALSMLDDERPESELQPPLDLIATLMQSPEAKVSYGSRVLDRVHALFRRPNHAPDFLRHLLTAVVVTCEGSDTNRDYALSLELHQPVQHYSTLHDPSLFVKTALCLFTFFWQRPEPEMAQRRLDLIQSLCDAMRAHPDELSLQRTCSAMLSDLAHADPEMKSRIVSLGGRGLVQRAMSLQSQGNDPQADAEWRLFAQFIRID